MSHPVGTHPLLVFVNPNSGGKHGSEVLRRMCYLLNPRQVYDITTAAGASTGLELFKDVRDARILCCGGDGTVAWLFDAIDKLGWEERPPIAALPLGELHLTK